MKRKPNSRDIDLPLVERAYLAFSGASRPINIEHSPYRDHLWVKKIETTPKKEISDEDISHYSACALTTIGNADNYRFYMPRILEAVLDCVVSHGIQAHIISERLEWAEWTNWSAEERAIVLEVAEFAAVREAAKFAVYREEHPWVPDDTEQPESWVFQLRRLQAMQNSEPAAPKRHRRRKGGKPR